MIENEEQATLYLYKLKLFMVKTDLEFNSVNHEEEHSFSDQRDPFHARYKMEEFIMEYLLDLEVENAGLTGLGLQVELYWTDGRQLQILSYPQMEKGQQAEALYNEYLMFLDYWPEMPESYTLRLKHPINKANLTILKLNLATIVPLDLRM
jgi:hypothetical protein